MSRHRLLIVQPYVPEYRLPFFQGLLERLDNVGIKCSVSSFGAHGEAAARGDQTAAHPWIRPAVETIVPFTAGRVRRGRVRHLASDCDGVILGLMGTALHNYPDLVDKRY